METFKKRQKEMRRLERQRDKAAKRKEIKARKAAGLPSESDSDSDIVTTETDTDTVTTTEQAAPSDPSAAVSTMD